MNKKDMNSHYYPRQLKQTAIIMLLLFAGCREENIIPDNPTGGNTELPDGTFHWVGLSTDDRSDTEGLIERQEIRTITKAKQNAYGISFRKHVCSAESGSR